jgi:hypothetical protein
VADLSWKIARLLAESKPKSELVLRIVLVQWENGEQVRYSPSLDGLSLYEKERLIEALRDSIRDLEETFASESPPETRHAPGGAGDEKVYLDYRYILLTSKRLVLRQSNTTYLISEIQRPRIERSSESARPFSLWSALFGPGITLSGETRYRDKLIVTVRGKDVVVDEHVYSNFSHAGDLHSRRQEFDAQGLSDAERSRKVMEQHEEAWAGEEGSNNWAARQRYLQHVAEAIGAAIAGA